MCDLVVRLPGERAVMQVFADDGGARHLADLEVADLDQRLVGRVVG